jgi:hypothetical protein
MPPREQPPQ